MILRFCFNAERHYHSIEVIDDIQIAHIAEQNGRQTDNITNKSQNH